METNSLTNLWKIDVIDRILTFSLLTKKSSKNFNMDFYWATFSIQTSVKIYSDRVRLLSSSMESLLFFLPGKINKFLDYDNKLGKKRNSTELNKFRTYDGIHIDKFSGVEFTNTLCDSINDYIKHSGITTKLRKKTIIKK